jgi:predicted nucleic acid-binding protein
MKLLIDTNVFLEVLLEDAKADEARRLLLNEKGHEVFVSDFAVHSIGLLLFRRELPETFREFLSDVIEASGIVVVGLTAQELKDLPAVASALGLDFDDAYQFSLAEKYDLEIVSFDKDFDRTARGRKTPTDLI